MDRWNSASIAQWLTNDCRHSQPVRRGQLVRCSTCTERGNLAEQMGTAKQQMKALVGAQRVELWFYIQIAQPKGSLLKGLLQPRESFVIFLQAKVNQCYVVR